MSELRKALEAARDKLMIYRRILNNEYQGGMEYTALMRLIEAALSSNEEAGEAARIVAWMRAIAATGACSQCLGIYSDRIERGEWRSTPIPTVKAGEAAEDPSFAASCPEPPAEAALAGAWEKCRETIRATLAARAEGYRAAGKRNASLTMKARAEGMATACGTISYEIDQLGNPYKIPTVNGTDEPPNAIMVNDPTGILAGVIPSEAGRVDMDYEDIARRLVHSFEYDRGNKLREEDARRKIAAALREAGGRVELVERED